jgi:hypothetical protein
VSSLFWETQTNVYLAPVWKKGRTNERARHYKYVFKNDVEELLGKYKKQITEYTFETLNDLNNYKTNYPNDILKTDNTNLKLTYNLEWK